MFLAFVVVVAAYMKKPDLPMKEDVHINDFPELQRQAMSFFMVAIAITISLIDYCIWKTFFNPIVLP